MATAVETLPQPSWRLRRRLRSIEVGKAREEYELHLQRRRLCRPNCEPLTPDAADPKLSRRAWSFKDKSWRCKLREACQLEAGGCSLGRRHEVASLVSTQAAEQMDEVDGSFTVISDDASSAQYLSE